MDAQELNINSTVGATEDVTNLDTPKMTKEEAQGLSDSELLQMIQKAQGHTNDFQNYMNWTSPTPTSPDLSVTEDTRTAGIKHRKDLLR